MALHKYICITEEWFIKWRWPKMCFLMKYAVPCIFPCWYSNLYWNIIILGNGLHNSKEELGRVVDCHQKRTYCILTATADGQADEPSNHCTTGDDDKKSRSTHFTMVTLRLVKSAVLSLRLVGNIQTYLTILMFTLLIQSLLPSLLTHLLLLLQERGVSLVHRSGGESGLRAKYELM